MSSTQKEKISFAKSYPFLDKKESYVFFQNINSETTTYQLRKLVIENILECKIIYKNDSISLNEFLKLNNSNNLLSSDFIPVLSYGSNGSSKQIKRKYSGFKSKAFIIPTIKAFLKGFDVVYTSLIAKYGSIPATIIKSEETLVEVFVSFIHRDLLDNMHRSEGLGISYEFIKLNNINLIFKNNKKLNSIYTYKSLKNPILINDSFVALNEILAYERKFISKTQIEILDYIKNLINPNKDLNTFILENIENNKLRKERELKLNHFMNI